jgi:hypothetical protein
MKLRIAVIVLALFSAQANAEWRLLGTNSVGNHYIDISSYQEDGNNRLIWTRTDYSKGMSVNGKIAWSDATLRVFNCNERQSGMKTIVAYSQKAQAGEVLWTSNTGNYQMQMTDIVPNTINNNIFKIVCSN